MNTRVVTNRWLGVIAVAIALSFVLGFFVNSAFFGTESNKNTFVVSDSFPYDECLGVCSQHSFTFGLDVVTVTVTHLGHVIFLANSLNNITNVGQYVISRQTACGATNAPKCGNGGVYIALSNDSSGAVTDKTCSGELTSNGLSRTLGTYAYTNGTNTDTITATFTYLTSSHSTTISKVCMFDAASGGNLFAESLLSPTATVSAVGDIVTIEWTFSH